MKQIPFAISLTAMLITGYLFYKQNKQLDTIQFENTSLKSDLQNLKPFIDSLKNELFIAQTNQNRYEIALDYLKEEDEKAWEKFEEILRTKTE